MATHRIFICYSRKDEAGRDRFLCHLDPFERNRQFTVWYDQRIEPGERWRDEIFQALDQATVAVVLVSPDLLASKFVMDEELPRLFRAVEERDLLLTTLHLVTSSFEVPKIPVDGTPRSLGEIQALNDPKEPVGNDGASEARLKSATDKLWATLADRPVTDRRDRPRKEIHLALDRRNGRVLRRSGRPPYFDSYGSQCRYPESRLANLGPTSDELGRVLLEVLLGGEGEQLDTLRAALRRPLHSPERHAFRVRILTQDDTLRQLPWSFCRTSLGALVDQGWTFELSAGNQPQALCNLASPCPAVFVAPQGGDGSELHVKAHEHSFEGLLQRAWGMPLKGSLFTRVSTREALEEQLVKEPRLVYFYACGRDGDRGAELLLDDGALPLSELADWMARHPPQVVVINTPDDIGPAPVFPRVAACLQLRGVGDSRRTRQFALDWWFGVLQLDHDPARAFCALHEDARCRGLLTTNYDEWQHVPSDVTPKVDRARAHLDRRDQRRVVREAIEELVRSPTRRMTCLVVYGAEGNLVQHFAVQLAATLRTQAHDLVRLVPHSVWFDDEDRGDLDRSRIRDAFREAMKLQPLDGLDDAFAQRARGPRAQPVHFFNWGTYPSPRHPEKLSAQNIVAWLDFCRDELAAACPDSTQGVAYLSLETPEENHAKLEEWLMGLATRLDSRRFTVVPVPALGKVEASDLLHFLLDDHNSSCPEALRSTLPARIVAKTGGSFEATVELLEEAERGFRWPELDEELPEADSPTNEVLPEL